ncbi:MAG: diguanylate cyclase [Candidatus Parabeggiatoa sp. nov. 3]|nr:MAG: diguanylate cyclase [Gammaproteobacteria bacterium]RKZ57809.1 MAG: diguanylate cyclase [Gammaproteobacteria bacterium]RKZ84665.1 MAG: diguanylate cyclase [Gammaproteobacteria bacterium]
MYASEEVLRTQINASPDMICFKDGEGRWLEANQAILKVFQLEEVDYQGKTDAELARFTHPLYREAFLACEASDKLAWQKTTLSRAEEVIPTRQGYRVFDVIKVPIFDTEGKRKGLVLLGRDITEHKQAEEKRLRSEARLAEAQHIAHLAYWEWNLITGQEEWSKEMFRILGLSPNTEINPEIFEAALHPDDRDMVLQAFEHAIYDGRSYQVEFRIVRPDGTICYVQAFGKLIRNAAGKPHRFLGTAQNITKIKQVEESLRQTNEQLQLRLNELAQRNQEISLLSQMGNLLQTCLTVEEAYTVIVRFMGQLFPDTIGMLAMFEDSSVTLENVATWGQCSTNTEEVIFAPTDCWALRQKRPYYMLNKQTHPLCNHLFSATSPLYMCVPMIAQGELLGLLHIAQPELASSHLNEAHQRLAETVSEQIALALANIKLRQTFQDQSIRDALTGLYNRRYLDDTLERELYRADRNQVPVGILMVDIDHFKQFNDTYGHAAGDVVLQKLGQFLNDYIRKGDIACRYGGEEFTLILPGAALEVVEKRAEVIKNNVKKLIVKHDNQNLGIITLSIGVACFPEHGPQFKEVLRAADTALYTAKRQGRDRVVVAE